MKDQDYVNKGIIFGSGIGVVVGILTDNIALGIALGTALGITIGAAFKEKEEKKNRLPK